ncbi:MAG: Npt1/Npt2 family nucleotide transporter [Rickettsiales bacterium]
MSNNDAAKNSDPSKSNFGWFRGIFLPIHNFELKKFLPMCFMMMCILFNYNVLRDTKDTLVVNAPGAGAESIGFLKLSAVTPAAILFMVIFIKLVNIFKKETIFYGIVTFFIGFFTLFGFIIYPNIEFFHMSLESIQNWQAAYPSFHWFIPVIGNWTFSLFYIFSELWGSVMIGMLFWQFANQTTKPNEAKRFYGMYGFFGNLGLVAAGALIQIAAAYAKSNAGMMENGMEIDTFRENIKMLTMFIALAGFGIIYIYYWMQKNVLTDPTLYNPEEITVKKKKEKMSVLESFKYILTNPYLMLIAGIIIAYGTVIVMVEGVWKGQIKLAFPDKNDYNNFMGIFTQYTGIVTMVLMIVGTNILRRMGWLIAALITPILILVTSALFFLLIWSDNNAAALGQIATPETAFMGLSTVLIAVYVGMVQNISAKGTKYALFDPTKQMAYMPLDDETKTKGQGAVEVIGGRLGKSGGAFINSSLLAGIGGNVTLASLTWILGPLSVLICLLWIGCVFGINRKMVALESDKNTESKA